MTDNTPEIIHAEDLQTLREMREGYGDDASRFTLEKRALDAAQRALTHSSTEQEPERYFASGPEGHFYTADLTLARKLVTSCEHADDWTITDLTGVSAVDAALPIPVEAARSIADRFGYDQVMVIARRVGDEPLAHGEHVTTYGRGEHRAVAARLGDFIKHKVMGWPQVDDAATDRIDHLLGLLDEVRACFTRDDDLPGDLLQRIDTAVDGHNAG